jgi:hypothetical protein
MKAIVALCAVTLLAQSPDTLRTGFLDPPDDARIMMRWWWFGPSVTKAQLEREMNFMKQGGIGGFEVQPTYPLALDDASKGLKNLPFLSADFLDALKFTSIKSRELGLRMDLTLGSGWPFGGPQIPVGQAAGQLRFEKVPVKSKRVPLPDLGNGEQLIAAFQGGTDKELTSIRDGFVHLQNEPKPAEIWFFIASRTGQMVKRASLGAEGFVLDHYDRSATQHYLKSVGEPLLRALPVPPKAIFCDSLEVFGSDWTPSLLAEFQKRRGYDLKPHLPALVSDRGLQTAGVRHDWGRTLTELLEERFLAPMRDWSKSNKTDFRIQNYGIPPAVLSSNAFADISEGEGSEWKTLRASRWASSASHIYGRPVTTSETWTWLHSPSFRATPLDMKAEADIHFLQGVNQLIGHGWPYTSEGVDYPGWRFYAAAVFNNSNPWWLVMPDITKYLQRVSFLMRQGKPANDVALYLPNSDAWSNFSAGKVHMIEVLRERVGPNLIPDILDAGYGFDFFDDKILEQLGKIDGKSLILGANSYSAVVLPPLDTIPPATLERLSEFARAGGIVIASKRLPSAAPGFKTPEAHHAQVREMAKKFTSVDDVGPALRSALKPDVAISPANPNIGFVHRRTGTADIYFVANTGNTKVRSTLTFRVTRPHGEIWDPMTGKTVAPATPTLAIELAPYESKVIVFSDSAAPTPAPQVAETKTIDLSSGWNLAFGADKSQPIAKLQSWTAAESTRYFSGTATYTRSFEAPQASAIKIDFGEGMPLAKQGEGPGMRAWLDGPIREAAVIYVNGQRAGSLWAPPYQLDITPFVRTGANDLRIDVANLAVNHMAGRPLPNYGLLNLRYGNRFDPQDMDKIQPVPSGITGPIQLLISQPEVSGRE